MQLMAKLRSNTENSQKNFIQTKILKQATNLKKYHTLTKFFLIRKNDKSMTSMG